MLSLHFSCPRRLRNREMVYLQRLWGEIAPLGYTGLSPLLSTAGAILLRGFERRTTVLHRAILFRIVEDLSGEARRRNRKTFCKIVNLPEGTKLDKGVRSTERRRNRDDEAEDHAGGRLLDRNPALLSLHASGARPGQPQGAG